MRHLSRILTCTVVIILVASLSIPRVDAQLFGGVGRASEATQRLNNIELAASTIQQTATAVATTDLFAKENILDGLAWSIAKNMVSQMMRSMINWVNSGFQGSPAFVTDIKGMLLNAADETAGEYIQSLGGTAAALCSPFALDVQVALSLNFAATRDTASGVPQNSCTLSQIGDNLEGFLSGTMDSWDQWLQVTTNPQNTPYGAYLQAEQEMYARIQNAQGEILTEASWGDGFLSKKICEAVEGTFVGASPVSDPSNPSPQASGPAASGANCIISTPGQVISQQINQQLGLGSEALVEADEINELISALLNQLTLKAVQGINGLLGLSSGTGYTDNFNGTVQGDSFLDDMVADQIGINLTLYRAEMLRSRDLETTFLRLINNTASSARLQITVQEDIIAAEEREDSDDRNESVIRRAESRIVALNQLLAETNSHLATTTRNIASTTAYVFQYDNASGTASSSVSEVRQDIVIEFVTLRTVGVLMTQVRYDTLRREWELVLNPPF